ncbi:zincin-like metallopeptidase domain-containing protein [Xanthomonas translucens]|uniref:zincin-like metallopeptidase domain-containing protein n=1 Tax=Xanthomonas campestris pv. translucens TaxID=343 RepID=UPI00071E726F|nr:zincin-like metallopeptidase domain-containing protein [Xanthomonas translucens]
MPITQGEAQGATLAFTRDYPGALELIYHFRESTGELYGHRAAEVPADLKGGYLSKEHIHNGRSYRGRVDVPLGNMEDAADLLVTLRHEVLGHYGANTFAPAEKRALLDGIIAAREQPGMKDRWEDINRRYAGTSMDVRAEEVWALHCETLAPGQHVGQVHVRERGEQSFMETCIARVRPMQVADLDNIVCMVADGLHDRSRTQQTFPQINELFRRDEAMEPKKPFHEVVAEKLIEQLKAGTAPWQRPWEPGEPNAYLPMNPTTGKRYKGINAIHLMAQGRSDGRWMTYKQAAAVGAQVRKGEKGTPFQYWKFSEEQNKVDENGRPVLNAKGEPLNETVQLERPRVFFATVFNAEQIDGLPPIQKQEQTWNAIDRAEHILRASGASITHAPGDRAFYRPATDSIHLPDRGQFPSADNYYATALHELGHWTGHPSRLDRDLAHPFGSEGYAKEELRAEIASMIVGDELGIGHDPGQHAAYVGSWIKALQDEPLEVFRAAADAEKIHDYVLAFEQKQVQEQEQARVQQGEAQQLNDELREHGQQIVSLLDAQSRWGDGERIFAFHEQDGEPHQVKSLDDLESYVPDQLLALPGLVRQQEMADRLALIDANSQTDEYEKATRLARVQEDRVRRDPNSTDEDISAAKEARKALEAKAFVAVEEAKNTQEQRVGAADQQPAQAQAAERQYISVPFKEKDEAKQLGARWDRKEQSWYVPSGVDAAPFAKWAQGAATAAAEARPTQQAPEAQGDGQKKAAQQARQYLAVPYEQRNAAKAAGALWDKAAKSWYAGPRADMAKLEQWKPENVQAQQGPAMTPREEFAEAMRSAGLFTGSNAQGDHPIMDGKRHRVPVEGGKKGALDGFYVGHLDGHPAGRIINNKTGADITWKSKGYALSDQEKAKLQAEAAEKLAQRAAEQDKLQEATAQRVGRQMADLMPVEQPTPYLQAKGIEAHAGVFTDREGQKTYIPAFDVDGKQWTMQYIQEDGTKRFAKDSKKEGCFHPVGGMDALAAAPALVISEGYATAAQVAGAVSHATVAAFDSGNLEAVAKALHAKYPDKPIIIAGDDDRHLVMTHGNNPGREKAEAAAQAVGGKAIFPIFAPTENSYPGELPAITPESYKTHLRAEQRLADASAGKSELADAEAAKLKASMLSGAQLAALSMMKQHTDFNDLAHRSELGNDGLKRQVGAAVGQVLIEEGRRQQQEQRQEQRAEKQQQPEQRPRRAARLN